VRSLTKEFADPSVAKYRAQLLEPEKKKAAGEGFDVMKSGGEW